MLDANGKYVIERVTVTEKPPVVPMPGPIPWPDRLDNENPRFPFDDDVKQGKTLAIDCEHLPGGGRYGEED